MSQKGDVVDGFPSGHRGTTSSVPKGLNRAPNVDKTSTTDNIAAAFSSNFLGSVSPCSILVRSEIGGRPISSLRDHAVINFPPLNSGSGSVKVLCGKNRGATCRKGVSGANRLSSVPSMISGSFAREHVSFDGSYLPELRAAIGVGACFPKWSYEAVDSTHSVDLQETTLLVLFPSRSKGDGYPPALAGG